MVIKQVLKSNEFYYTIPLDWILGWKVMVEKIEVKR